MVAARRYPRTKTISGSRATSDLEPRAHDVVYGHGPQCLRRQPSLHAAFLEASKLLKRKVGSCATSMDVFLTSDGESNPVPFDRLKSAVSLGAPLEPRARKHRTRSRAPVSLAVVDVQWEIALPAPVQGTTRHHGAAGRAKETR